MTIHNRNRSNREPRTRARYNVEYVSGNCPNCGVPYALEAGKEFHPENCWMCAYIATHKTTAQPVITAPKVIITKSFAERWTTDQKAYQERYGIDNVEVKGK